MTQEISNKIANMGIVCALLVVFIHLPIGENASASAWQVYSCFSHGVGKIAVPFFFGASGYLLAGHFGEVGWYGRAVFKRMRTLYVPLVIWSILFFLYGKLLLPLCANMIAGRSVSENINLSMGLGDLARILAIHPFAEPYLGVLWFVRMLLVLVFFSPIFKRLATPMGVMTLFLLQALVGPELGGTPDKFHFTFLKGFFPICGATSFCCGMLLRNLNEGLRISRWQGLMGVVVSLFVIAVRGNPYSSKSATLLTWIYIPVLLAGLWSLCPTRRFPTFLTTASFPVYVLHMFAIKFLRMAMPGFFGQLTAGRYVLLGLASFATCVLVSYVLRKVAPRTSAVLFGGR